MCHGLMVFALTLGKQPSLTDGQGNCELCLMILEEASSAYLSLGPAKMFLTNKYSI